MKLINGNMLSPFEGSPKSVIKDTMRILKIDQSKDLIVAISIVPKRSKGRIFFHMFRYYSYKQIEKELNASTPLLKVVRYKRRKIQLLSDTDIAIRFNQSIEKCKVLNVRNQRWEEIKAVVLAFQNSFDKKELSVLIKGAVKKSDGDSNVARARIRGYLSQYFALGSEKNSLLPFHENCGGLGKKKNFTIKTNGRKNAATRAGIQDQSCPIIDVEAQKIILHSWIHFLRRGVSVSTAYRRMCNEFYTDIESSEDFLCQIGIPK